MYFWATFRAGYAFFALSGLSSTRSSDFAGTLLVTGVGGGSETAAGCCFSARCVASRCLLRLRSLLLHFGHTRRGLVGDLLLGPLRHPPLKLLFLRQRFEPLFLEPPLFLHPLLRQLDVHRL